MVKTKLINKKNSKNLKKLSLYYFILNVKVLICMIIIKP
ncbi:hypothetical protein NC99_14430 [Sunxiuqinia dokdonensis]|uniref:Uncharacterized protein n=1 Tax=Sunxiuqinia dokdonensis TaxID=1409788 RepID=A0A0L8VBA2_9BACT|nr:hypothetical protein NC99_14430 [Sunxiuqinia dokdonensis]